jgi:prolyl-tRNA synthetase
MKDMYSLARNQAEHERLYDNAIAAYMKIYNRLGIGDITYRTFAEGGIFTDRFSDEWQTVSDIGEDTILVDEDKKIAINKDIYSVETLANLGLDGNKLVEKKGIEAGNTFHLETKYTDALGVNFIDEKGQKQPIIMGCYGIGISRTMGILAEHFADEKGLIWPENVAPFKVYLVQIGTSKDVIEKCKDIYIELNKNNISVLWDDRNERPGVKFADADLYGIPVRLVISEKTIQDKVVEVKKRRSSEVKLIHEENLIKGLAS